MDLLDKLVERRADTGDAMTAICDAAAAEDQTDAARRHGRAQLPRRQRIGGIGPLAGAAEYGDGVQLFHGPG